MVKYKRKLYSNGTIIRSIDVQRDLREQVHYSLKIATQVNRVVKKMYNIFAYIGQGIEH